MFSSCGRHTGKSLYIEYSYTLRIAIAKTLHFVLNLAKVTLHVRANKHMCESLVLIKYFELHHCTRMINMMCSRKFREGGGESVRFSRGGPGTSQNLARYVPNKQPSVLRKDSVMLAAWLRKRLS